MLHLFYSVTNPFLPWEQQNIYSFYVRGRNSHEQRLAFGILENDVRFAREAFIVEFITVTIGV
jgi:hypothetical protein